MIKSQSPFERGRLKVHSQYVTLDPNARNQDTKNMG